MNQTVEKPSRIPSGFTEVDASNEIPPKIQWEEGLEFTGLLKRIQTMTVKTKDGTKQTRVMVFDTAHGPRSVWESAGLRGVLEVAQPGDEWWLCMTGIKDTGEPSPMRVFKSAVRRV